MQNYLIRHKYIDKRKVDVPYLILNIDKLKTILDINFISIEKSIKKTYEWLKNKI